MRIDSSTIGMESARNYTSVSGRMTKFTITDGGQSLEDGTGALFGDLLQTDGESEDTQTNEKENPFDKLQSTVEEMRSKVRAFGTGSVSMTDISDTHLQLKEIRRQCVNYLIELLFPNKRSGGMPVMEEMTGTGAYLSSGMQFASMNAGIQTFRFSTQYYHAETESTAFSTQGTVKCADGREIDFNLNLEMSRSFQEYYEKNVSYAQVSMCDPLVINLNGNIAELSDQTFLFDIDGDGQEDEVSRLMSGSGFLALDKNGDGMVNDGTELFGTASGNGFADLAAYDADGNGFIDEGDEIWNQLKIWVTDENGNQQLYSLAEKGVGAICLQNASTDFTLTGGANQTNGMIRNTGFFLYENGGAGTVQHVDMAKHGKTQQAQDAYERSLYGMVI